MRPIFEFDALRQASMTGQLAIRRGQAMGMLADSGHPDRARVLESILQDSGETAKTRAMAAAALGRVPLEESEQVLLRHLPSADALVQMHIGRSLALVGTLRSLPLLDSFASTHTDHRGEVARFAATVIAHRYAVPGHDWLAFSPRDVLELHEKDARSARLVRLEPDDVCEVHETLRRFSFGQRYDSASLRGLDCVGERRVICMNAEVTAGGGPREALQRKMLAGLVLLRNTETVGYSLSQVLLMSPQPDGKGSRILAPHASGRPGLAGAAWLEEGGWRFQLRALSRPGAVAIEVDGRVAGSSIEITAARAGLQRVPPLVPDRMAEGLAAGRPW